MEVTSELKLTNLTHRDIGAYQCIVENLYGATYSVKAEIQVYVFPQFVLTPEDKTVQGGTSVSLKCSATGETFDKNPGLFQTSKHIFKDMVNVAKMMERVFLVCLELKVL